ncbi:hypothetical protein PoB_007475000 [Plakobranchus ocellatus]|uniref:BCL-11A-like CCHC zinc finger domain-containing protein n=1 Tax=Plakobranchus ocellatus TaxID=259542 RepID=A0AAV4DW63_9GAST|nr:hypothetical protein PoB_007475000 [Plakobranchus ocellatus]
MASTRFHPTSQWDCVPETNQPVRYYSMTRDCIYNFLSLSISPPTVEQEKDLLVCGDCQTSFALHDIVTFIRHKKQCCDKENLRHDHHNSQHGDADHNDEDDEHGKGTRARCPKASVGGRTNSDGDDATAASRRADGGVEDDDEGVDVSKASRREEGDDVTADEDDDDDEDEDGDLEDDDEDEDEDVDGKEDGDAAMDTSGQHSMVVNEEERKRRRRMRKRKRRLMRLKKEKEEEESASGGTPTKRERDGEREVKRERSGESRAPLRPKQVVDAESNTTHSASFLEVPGVSTT